MNDFKAGHILGTNPKAQWLGQAFGGIIGAVIATIVMVLLVQAYGPAAFGTGGEFVAAQASVVATMISGIPCIEAFVIGLIAGYSSLPQTSFYAYRLGNLPTSTCLSRILRRYAK